MRIMSASGLKYLVIFSFLNYIVSVPQTYKKRLAISVFKKKQSSVCIKIHFGLDLYPTFLRLTVKQQFYLFVDKIHPLLTVLVLFLLVEVISFSLPPAFVLSKMLPCFIRCCFFLLLLIV